MNLFTLHIEHAVLLGLFTILTLINRRLHDGASGSYWFSAYTGAAFVGSLLVALRGHGVPNSVSIVLGMVAFHVAYLFLHASLRAFFQRNGGHGWGVWAHGAIIVAATAGLIEYGILQPDTGRRVVFYSGIFALQAAIISAMVFARAREGLTRPAKVMGVLLALLAANNLNRAIFTLHNGAPRNYMEAGLGLQLTLLGTTVLQVGIMVAFVWMTAAVLHERLDVLASTDPLTGLLNRRALETSAEREIALARKTRRPVTAVLIDLDRFKQINDSFGHSFGDKVLISVARCMQQHMRQSDLLARVGGDEFAVLLNDTSREEAMEIVERLRTSIEDLVVMEGECETRMCASFGLAEADGATLSWPELVRKCDTAVYRVKSAGGNLAAAH
jgi:diguanylate cyclase (GGDEF)-like protein